MIKILQRLSTSLLTIIIVLIFVSSESVSLVKAADEIPPSPISNLKAETGLLPGTVILDWNAPGDDATTGTATSYAIRYGLTPIDDANWDSAFDVTDEPNPESAGTPQTMVVGGLPASRKIYFAIKSVD